MRWFPDNPLIKNRPPSQDEVRKIVRAKKSSSTRGSLPTSTNYYLHDPRFPESVHIGKTYASVGGLGWMTDISLAELRWSGTASLVAYLEELESTGALQLDDGNLYVAWVADEYGSVLLPKEMARQIMAAVETSTMRASFA